MIDRQGTLGVLPLFCILVLGIGLMNHVMVVPPLMAVARRDAWLSVLVAIVPFMAWTTFLYGIMRFTQRQPLLPWLRRHYGRVASGLLRAIFIVYLFFMCIMTLKDTVTWTHNTYLPRTPLFALALSLVLLCVMAAWCGIQAIAVTAGILLPFVILFGDFVMSMNLPVKNYTLLQPILEHGWYPMLCGSLYVGGGLAELIVILLLQQELKRDVSVWKMWLLSLFLVLLVLGPVAGAIAEFGPEEAAKLRYPAFEEWRLVTIGQYIRHVDFLSIFQWLSGAFIRIAVSFLLLADLLTGSPSDSLSGSGSKRKQLIWIAVLAAASIVIVVLPISDMQYVRFMRQIYLPASFWGITGVVFTLFGLAWIANKSRGKQKNGA